jgi:predicted nucleic acid-binding protein
MTLAEAAEHVRSWLARRVSQVLEGPAGHTEQVIGLLEAAGGTAGNLVTDAQIAAFAQSYRAVVHTADRDFLRFPDVRCHFPLDG